MKNLFAAFLSLVILFVAPVSAYASDPYKCYEKGTFALDLSMGDNIDLSSLSQEQKAVFDERPHSAFQISLRPCYYFSRHWGSYVDLSLCFFRFNDKESLLDVLMPGISKLKPTLSLGETYHFEHGPWQIEPRLGVGIVVYGHSSSKRKFNEKETIRKLSGCMWSVDAGVSAAYRASNVCSIFVDFRAMQPFTPAKYSKTTTVDGVTTGYKVNTYTWGRSMTVSIGIRLQAFGK